MKITGDVENTIIKMIKEATLKANDYDESQIAMYEQIELYEVEKWECDPVFTYNTYTHRTYFTSLVEATEYYEEAVRSIRDSIGYNTMMDNSLATYYSSDCFLRKVKFALLDENNKTLDRNIEPTLKEFEVTMTKYDMLSERT